MQTFGDYLKKQREAIKVSLREVAHLTHITERYLDYIEKDDYAKIPEGPYVRGYIASYATAIGINADEALDRFDSSCRERNQTRGMGQKEWEGKRRPASIAFLLDRRTWFLLSLTTLIFLTFGVYHLSSQDQKKAPVITNLQEATDTGLRAVLPVKSKDNVSKLSLRDDATPSDGIEDPQTGAEHGDNQKPQMAHSAESPVNEGAEGPPKSTGLTSVSIEQTEKSLQGHEKNTEVLEAAVCAGVKDRTPSGESHTFPWSTARIYVWNLIKCDSSQSSIRHIYYFKGRQISNILLDIKSSLWRTWSCRTLLDKRYIGPWRVDITSADGGLLQRLYFEVR